MVLAGITALALCQTDSVWTPVQQVTTKLTTDNADNAVLNAVLATQIKPA